MKIAVVVSTFPPYKGGMGNVAKAHVEAFTRAGHDVTVFAPGKKLWPLLRIGNAAVMPQLLWKLRGFNVVELHYPFFGAAEWVLCWKRLFGRRTRLVTFYHMDTVGRGALGLIFRLYRALFLKAILRASDRIIVTSKDYAASSQIGTFAQDAKTVEIPLAVDIQNFSPANPLDRSKGGGAIFVGALDAAHYFKGIDILLRAFFEASRACPKARLVIVGDGDLRPIYEAQAKALGLADRVTFLGKVPDDQLPETYRGASFNVLPSVDRSEAFGLVTLEAAASGIPSIVTDLPGVRSVVKDGETGFIVPPDDTAALAAAMTRLFDVSTLAERMGQAARLRAEKTYSTEAVNRRLLHAVVE